MSADSVHSGDYQKTTVSVENVGGIDRCDVSFRPGVTVLSGRNATNRTSLLNSIADVLGGSPATLKTDADHGRIELRLDDGTYVKEYDRTSGALSSTGEQFTDERDLVDLFVRILEDNPARRAVERDDDIRDILMKPVDTEQIQRDIREHEHERERIDEQLRDIERSRDRLPDLESRRVTLEDELVDIEEEVAALHESIDKYEADRDAADRADDLLSELESVREDYRDVEAKLERHDERLEELREQRETVADELADVDVPDEEFEAVRTERDRLHRQRREMEDTIDDLLRIVNFNQDLLEGEGADLPGVEGDTDVTGALDPTSQTVECWTCGSDVQRRAIADRLDELRTVVQDRRSERDEIDDRIETLDDRVSELQRQRDQVDQLRDRLDEIEDEIEVREEKRSALSAQREEIREEIAALETRVEETEELRDSDLVEMYRNLNELEYERGRVERELDDVEDQIDAIEAESERHDRLQERRDELSEEIQSLRSRIDDLERKAVEQFNDHMAEVLSILEYSNIARVWIERKTSPGTGSREQSTFALHVVRETTDGSMYEDTIDTLSESEREVIGLVVALAGYLVHEVYREVPFILLDSLEAIDAERIEALVDYFSEYAPYLVVALLPEDASALQNSYEHVTATALSSQ